MGLTGFEGPFFGVGEEGEEGDGDGAGGGPEGGDGLGASDVADLLTQTSFPSVTTTRSQPPFSSRIFSEAPFFAVPTTL